MKTIKIKAKYTAHTALPWKYERLEKSTHELRGYLNGADKTNICGISERHCGTNEADANAAFIVRACNNFNALLRACRFAQTQLKDPKVSLQSDVLKLLDKAIEQAEQEGK